MDSLAEGQPDFYTQSFGDANVALGEWRSSAYVQDHWTARRNLTFDLGIRYEENRLPDGFSLHSAHLSPRFGFAWSPGKDWVMRGGFGTFFDRFLLSTIARIDEFNGKCALQQVAEEQAAAALYGAGRVYGMAHRDIAPGIWRAAPVLKNPYAETASVGVERALPSRWTVNAEYRHVEGVHMGRSVNVNLPAPILLTPVNAAGLGIVQPTAEQLGRMVFAPQRLDPAYDAINQFETEAHSTYNGATISVNRQFTENFELLAGYTRSKTMDDASYDPEQPQNPYALRAERAPSLEDQQHRFVLSGLWILGPDLDDPADAAKAAKPNSLQKFLYGFEFAPILIVGSGFPENPLTGVDSNREHAYRFAARPLGYGRNSLRTPPDVSFDMRILKMMPVWRGHLDIDAESFNVLNRQNVSVLNDVYGSQSWPAIGFRQPIEEADPRRVQFSLDFEF